MTTISDRQSAGKQVEFRQLPIDLNGFESKYKITNDGRIYSDYLDGFLKPFHSRGGYVRVKLNYGDRSKKFLVHRLVALAFIENPENKEQVDHIDRDRTNNNSYNLQWVSSQENNSLAVQRGSRDSMLYVFTNQKTGEVLKFSNRHKMLKYFGKVCLRYIRQIAERTRKPLSGAWSEWDIERIPLKLQRLSPAGEYIQVDGNGKNPTIDL